MERMLSARPTSLQAVAAPARSSSKTLMETSCSRPSPPRTGRELYRYDRGGGAQLLKDINPGAGSGVPGGAPTLSAGNVLYFTANSPANGTELWSTDGTALGTKLIQDFNPGPNSSNPRALVQLASGNIMVAADNGLLGNEPYVVTASTPAFKPLNDFNGDGKSDYAVYRPDLPTVDPIFNPIAPNLSYWYTILNQGDTSASVYDWERQWGLKGDIPVAGDYDGDGRTDYTVYRPTDVPWLVPGLVHRAEPRRAACRARLQPGWRLAHRLWLARRYPVPRRLQRRRQGRYRSLPPQ